MQASRTHLTASHSPSFASQEKQLRLALNDDQNNLKNQEQPGRSLPRHSVAAALQGFKLTDLSAITLGFICACILEVIVNVTIIGRYDLDAALHNGLSNIGQSMIVGVCLVGWFAHKGHYRMRIPFWTETKHIVEATGFAMLVDIFFRFLVKQDFSRLWMISGWVFAAIGIACFRSLWRRHKRKQGAWNVSTLLIGGGDSAEEARSALASEPGLGFEIVAQVENLPVAFGQAGYSWKNLCAAHHADYVIIALEGADLMHTQEAFAQLMREGIPFSVSPPLHNVPVLGMVPQYFFNHDVMLLTHNHGLSQRMPSVVKRLFDIVVSSLALLTLSPLFLTVAVLVKKDGGPAFFKQKRPGMNGKIFYCLKFRSMVKNGDKVLKEYLEQNPEIRAEWHTYKKLRHGDPRVTKIGKLIRRLSIDELPQLLNVLKGDMSLVGPRPILLVELDEYGTDVSHYYRVRPGITGLWQVSGRNNVTYAQRVQMDSWYVRNWSLWHDIAILFKTIPAVLNRKGAF